MFRIFRYSKTCVKRPIEIDKTKILMTNGSLMKVKSIAEWNAPLGAFCNTFDLQNAPLGALCNTFDLH